MEKVKFEISATKSNDFDSEGKMKINSDKFVEAINFNNL